MTSRRPQRDRLRDDSKDDHSFAALEAELHATPPGNSKQRRNVERNAARAEAASIAPSGNRFIGRPVA